MTISSGDFFWYDVMTRDPKAAIDFYTKVVGWGAQEAGVDGSSYTVLTLDGGKGMGVAGLMGMPPTVVKDGRGTMESPWPPMRSAWMSRTEQPSSRARKAR